jgi:acetylornithine/succinyldiaminopimelate/putrescine aminotransferase
LFPSLAGARLVGTVSVAKPGLFSFSKPAPTPSVATGRVLLPVNSADVLSERYSAGAALSDEMRHGNGDLIRALEALGVAGPFKTVSPWVLADETGKEKINAGGYAAIPFGDRYPPLVRFVQDYLEHDRAMGLPQQSAASWRAALETNLVALLATFAPSHADSRVFFSNSGAEAIETAIKFVKAARPKAKEIINFKGAYHGKTFGALALTPNAEYQDMFRPLMPNVTTLPYGDLMALETAVRRLGAAAVAAVIVEPTQGEAGVISPPDGFLRGLGELCGRHGILVIADEIQTGLGRTGHWFASIAAGLEPDIVTLAKPLGAGITAVGATIARRGIFGKTLAGFSSKRHSNTFGGNSLAMAIGVKALEMLVQENLPERSRTLGAQGLERLRALQGKYPNLLENTRGAGMLMALQFRTVIPPRIIPGLEELIGELSGALGLRTVYEGGVIANLSLSSKRVVRLTPALNIPEDLFSEMFNRIEQTCERSPTANHMLRRTPVDRLYRLGRLAFAK